MFYRNSTGSKKIDFLLYTDVADIFYMPPSVYVKKCETLCGKQFNDWVKVDNLLGVIKNKKVPMPFIDCSHRRRVTQDGMHRAIASSLLDGEDACIPVVVVQEINR